jgi:predicted DNA-binding WGR domain protein
MFSRQHENRFALTLHRIDPARHMARFYTMDVRRDLFGCIVLTKQWGRIGTHGRRAGECHATEALAVAAMQRQAERKRRRGYRYDGITTRPEQP